MIEVKEVRGRRDMRRFVRFPFRLYRNERDWCPPLVGDEFDTFNPRKNGALRFCEHQCFLAYMDGQIVGRIAAIINRRSDEKSGERCLRFGWLDCIDSPAVCSALMGRDPCPTLYPHPMPRYKPKIRFSDCWSSVGDVTFYHRNGVCYWKKRAHPEFPGTLGQMEAQSVHLRALQAWRELDPLTQEQWNMLALTVQSHRLPFRKDHHITGHNLFVSGYHGKSADRAWTDAGDAAPATITISALAQKIGWPSATWDFSGSVPKLLGLPEGQ